MHMLDPIPQDSLIRAMRNAAHPIPDGLLDGVGRPAGRRFNVYRNNIATSLIEALRAGFPTLEKLLGDENFTYLARQFIAAHPPISPLMIYYGGQLPAFISEIQELTRYPYLSNIAQLEWAMRCSYHAPDHQPISHEVLSSFSSDELMTAQITLAPSLDLVSSPYPIVDIYKYTHDPSTPKPTAIAQSALIMRPIYDPTIQAICADDVQIIAHLRRGQSIAEILPHCAADYDPSTLFHHLISHSAIVQITPMKGL